MNGWKVYAIEANPNNIPLLKQHRNNVYNVAVADVEKESTEFTIVTSSNWTAGYSAIEISDDYKRIFGGNFQKVDRISVPQRTLNSLLANEMSEITSIDIVSLDIEGGEFNCLQGFDISKWQPKVFVIENVTDDQRINELMTSNGYIRIHSYTYNHYWVHKNMKV